MISWLLTHPIQKPTKADIEDPQRSRLYKMEREFVGTSINHHASRAHLQELANHACAYYKIKPLKIVVYSKPNLREFGESVYYINDMIVFGHTVRLNKGFHGANATTLLHELAHYIVDDTYEQHHDHGKQFAGVYMHLLAKYRILPSSCFRLLAKKWRIAIAGKFKPGAIRG